MVIAQGAREELTQRRLIAAIGEAGVEAPEGRLVLRLGDTGVMMRAERFITERLGAWMSEEQLVLDFGRLDSGCWELALEE